MRLLTSLLFAFGLSTPALSADASKVFTDIEVKISDSKLEKLGAGIRTLYITLYDEASKMPMPYGAAKISLEKDATGTVYKGKLDSSNIVVMGQGEAPKSLRIKAKLDKDGSAGPDAQGDLVGVVSGIKLGDKSTVTIDKAI